MGDDSFHRDNHYISRGYLKRFAESNDQVWTYRTLVSHPKVPFWKKNSTRGVGYHPHLYTRIPGGCESDEFERWLDREFESPAEEALRKATSEERLAPTDWKRLILFLAAQDVRTPTRLAESLERWRATLPSLLEETMKESIRKMETAKASGQVLTQPEASAGDYFPFRVKAEIDPGQEFGKLKSEIINGRSLWLFTIRHALTKTAKVLYQHRWTILTPPEDLVWFTSDSPVIRLNCYGKEDYDFKGSWGSLRSEILLPLSPRHLLYTQIGERPPERGEMMPRDRAYLVRRFIAEHAHRMIFANSCDAEIPKLRPRIVDPNLFREEAEQRRGWHEDQTAAERQLME